MNNEYIFTHITVILLVSALSGMLLAKLKQPVMIGYILAGVVFGPSGFSFISARDQIDVYADLGIVLLMFVIGMELNVRSFIRMWKIPTLFTIIQVIANTIIAVIFSKIFHFELYLSLLGAFIVSLSSTAAIVKVLEHLGETRSDIGHISLGILVAQDLAIIPMMLILNVSSSASASSLIFHLAFAILLVVLLVKFISKREIVYIPASSIIRSTDLTPVVILGFCFAVSSMVVLFGLSEAYGAFLAGLLISNTQERQVVLNTIKPIQSVLLMFFFISVGLLFDIDYVLNHLALVLTSVTVITVWKMISNTLTLRLFSIERSTSATIGIILSQLGEFSLILANIAVQSNIIDAKGQKLIVCVTALSLSLSSIFMMLARRTKNLSYVGDNSYSSILKVMFSRKFAKEVNRLTIERERLVDRPAEE